MPKVRVSNQYLNAILSSVTLQKCTYISLCYGKNNNISALGGGLRIIYRYQFFITLQDIGLQF